MTTIPKKKLVMEKSETVYRADLDASAYDYLEVVADERGRITVKFLDTRWRTPEETISMFEEIIAMLKDFPTPTSKK